ncbi:LysE family translocator [Mycolicibacterium baixiangningiae]|uniref:LysE family translocator n=1 Tax=Mycolicibacterium baixiangningiae TaxID=2761578 RepID=UPI0018CFF753|nr:LysE family translocator [Mycolicibacterium baixiangningiae]
MEISAVFAFAAVAFALIVVPGPDWAYVLAAGVRDHAVVSPVTGILLGYVGLTAIVAAGVGALVATAPIALVALTVAGAGYLIYLGVRVLRTPGGIALPDADSEPPRSAVRNVVRGAGVSALNPKGLLIFLAILPQFARPSSTWPMPLQLAALGLVFVALCAAVYLPLGHVAHRLLGARPRLAHITTRISGVAMILVGVALVAERL